MTSHASHHLLILLFKIIPYLFNFSSLTNITHKINDNNNNNNIK